MPIEHFVERNNRVKAVRWTGTEQDKRDVLELFDPQVRSLTDDGDGETWLMVGSGSLKLVMDWWVVNWGGSALVVGERDFRARFEVVAP